MIGVVNVLTLKQKKKLIVTNEIPIIHIMTNRLGSANPNRIPKRKGIYKDREKIVSSLDNKMKDKLKKYKEMLDEGLITQEQYDAKSNKLLDL